jgi:LacI family transcriptional regulator
MIQRKRIGIKDIAKQAGVSTATVSRVINDHPDVSPETRQMVNQVIERLGYQPSNLARSLIQGRSRTLGVVSSGMKYFGPSSIISAIEERASVLGYSVLLSLVRQPETNDVDQILSELLSRHVDGIVWAVPEIGNNRDWLEETLPGISVPVVFLSMRPRPGISVVEYDNRGGARMATQHLIDQGYRNIGLITGPLDWWAARQRQLGWQDALEEAHMLVQESLTVEGDWLPASGELGLYRLLERRRDVDAVFACNDQMALGALKAANFMGLQVPGDLAVVGFDDVPEAAYYCPPLTTVRQDMVALGHSAMQELGRLIDSLEVGKDGVEPNPIWIQPQLVVRKSSNGSQLSIDKQGGSTRNN